MSWEVIAVVIVMVLAIYTKALAKKGNTTN